MSPNSKYCQTLQDSRQRRVRNDLVRAQPREAAFLIPRSTVCNEIHLAQIVGQLIIDYGLLMKPAVRR